MTRRELVRLALEGLAGMRKSRTSFVQPGAESWPIFMANFDRGYVPPLAKIGAQSMTGRLTRREPVIRTGESPLLADFVEMATRDGRSFREFLVDAIFGVMQMGQQGVLLSWAVDSRYPKIQLFEPEDVVTIQVDRTRDQYRPVFVELREREDYYEPGSSGVRLSRVINRRLFLDSGYYVQEIVGREKTQRVEMSMYGRKIDFIPFMLLNADGKRFGDSESPVWPLVEIMAAILETSIAKRSAGRKVGMPTPVLSGFNETICERKQDNYIDASTADIEFFRQLNSSSVTEPVVRLGSDVVLKTSNPEARASFLEINPSGLSHLADEESRLYRLAASMGAAGVSPDQSTGEQRTATEVWSDNEDQMSVLSVAATMFSSRFTELLRWVARIAGETVDTGDVFVEVFVNVGSKKMDPALLANLINVVEMGYLSKKTFYEAMQGHGLTRADYTFEDEQSEIDEQVIG